MPRPAFAGAPEPFMEELFEVTSDLSRFGKAMAHGFPPSAPAGARDFMEPGGRRRTPVDPVTLAGRRCGFVRAAAGANGEAPRACRAPFLQAPCGHGEIASSPYTNHLHRDADTDRTFAAVTGAADVRVGALADGDDAPLAAPPGASAHRRRN